METAIQSYTTTEKEKFKSYYVVWKPDELTWHQSKVSV